MAVETDGTVMMRGDTGPGVFVRVEVADGIMRLSSGEEPVGEWPIRDLGIVSLDNGFRIRAEGEEFLLTAKDDAVLAEELGVVATTPRMARRVAALHNPDEPEPVVPDQIAEPKPRLLGIALALGGALVVLGGNFLRIAPASPSSSQLLDAEPVSEPSQFWLAFVIAGVLMVGAAWILTVGARWARYVGLAVMALLIGLFVWAISQGVNDASHVTAYGFIAGGLVVGVAVLFGGSLKSPD